MDKLDNKINNNDNTTIIVNNDNNDNNDNNHNNDNKHHVANDDDINLLSGDNKVDVEIEPDVKSNNVNIHLQFCSCSVFLHCFSKNSP
jgi:hypothetical protein